MNRKQFVFQCAASVGFALCFGFATAQEHGSRDEAKAMVDAAVAHVKKVGPEQAFKDFQTDKEAWFKKDLYVFAYNMQGVCVALGANEKMVGKNLIEMRDPNGKFIIKEFISTVSTKGAGWVDYEFANPTTKKFGSKESYVHKLPNFDGFVGVGIYR